MREVKKRSVVPIYAAALVWLIYALILPLYRVSDFLIAAGLSAAGYLLAGRIYKPTITYVEEPEPAVSYGEEIDAILAESERCRGEMARLAGTIPEPGVCSRIETLRSLTDKIARDLIDDPDDLAQVRRFFNYYPGTVLKLLNAYDRAGAQGIEGTNISAVKQNIEQMLDTAIAAYEKQLDSLFANQALDIETDIAVMNMKLSSHGLSGRDFSR